MAIVIHISRLHILLVALVGLISAVGAWGQDSAPLSAAILKAADTELVVFSDPDCPSCQYLKKRMSAQGVLQDSDQGSGSVTFKLNGENYVLPLTLIDNVWSASPAERSKLKEQGFLDRGVPQFAIINRRLSFKKAFMSMGLPAIRKELIKPLAADTFSSYVERWSAEHQRVADTNQFDLTASIEALLPIPYDSKSQVDFSNRLRDRNWLIVGTATSPLDNPWFTGQVIDRISKQMRQHYSAQPIALYGSGVDPGCDTCVRVMAHPGPDAQSATATVEGMVEPEHEYQLIKFPLPAAGSATTTNIAGFFNAVKTKAAQKNLITLVGHGQENGFPVWLEQDSPMSPERLRDLHKMSKATNVLVSGNCFGGIMAHSMSCSFMAAPPERPATGCWEVPQQNSRAIDYVSLFFEALTQPKEADYDQNNQVSFAEAHAYATQRKPLLDQPYDSIDATIAEFLEREKPLAEAASHEQSISLGAALKLIKHSPYITLAEKKVLDSLKPIWANQLMDTAVALQTIEASEISQSDSVKVVVDGVEFVFDGAEVDDWLKVIAMAEAGFETDNQNISITSFDFAKSMAADMLKSMAPNWQASRRHELDLSLMLNWDAESLSVKSRFELAGVGRLFEPTQRYQKPLAQWLEKQARAGHQWIDSATWARWSPDVMETFKPYFKFGNFLESNDFIMINTNSADSALKLITWTNVWQETVGPLTQLADGIAVTGAGGVEYAVAVIPRATEAVQAELQKLLPLHGAKIAELHLLQPQGVVLANLLVTADSETKTFEQQFADAGTFLGYIKKFSLQEHFADELKALAQGSDVSNALRLMREARRFKNDVSPLIRRLVWKHRIRSEPKWQQYAQLIERYENCGQQNVADFF